MTCPPCVTVVSWALLLVTLLMVPVPLLHVTAHRLDFPVQSMGSRCGGLVRICGDVGRSRLCQGSRVIFPLTLKRGEQGS